MRKSFAIAIAIISLCSVIHAKTGALLPPNVGVPGVLAGTVAHVYEQSTTFRAQCDRMAQAQNLRVTVKMDFNIPSTCRAFTMIRRSRGFLCAEVHLPPGVDLSELLGHEFEHILEQLDHLNLRALSHVRGSGVREVEVDLFETARAQRTGKIVAHEVLTRQERPSAD
jgi:hypothetical protein